MEPQGKRKEGGIEAPGKEEEGRICQNLHVRIVGQKAEYEEDHARQNVLEGTDSILLFHKELEGKMNDEQCS